MEVYFDDFNDDVKALILERVGINDPKEMNWDAIPMGYIDIPELYTATEAIKQMNEPREFMKGRVFDCVIDFVKDGSSDQLCFPVDCTTDHWRTDLLHLWEKYRQDEGLPERCVLCAWSTLSEEDD